MRTIKELLLVMVNKQQLFNKGLCIWTGALYRCGLINNLELQFLKDYINANRPSMLSGLDAWKNRDNSYYWTPDEISHRIKWLNKHIKLNS